MQAIKPISAVTASDFDVADYPACILALTGDSVSGNVLTDLVSGTLTFTGATITDNGDGSWQNSVSTDMTNSAFNGFGDDDGMLVVVGTMADSEVVQFGDGGSTEVSIAFKMDSFLVVNNLFPTNFASHAGMTRTGMTQGCGVVALENTGDDVNLYTYDATTGYETIGTTVTNSIDATYNFTTNCFRVPANKPFWGIYLMKWTAIPSVNEIKQAIAWMSANPTAGIYPGWKGRT